jgi:hypothetical protein
MAIGSESYGLATLPIMGTTKAGQILRYAASWHFGAAAIANALIGYFAVPA